MSSPNIVIVNIGTSNLFSVARAVEQCGFHGSITSDPEDVRRADRVVLPGVGAFGEAMGRLTASGMADSLRESASQGKPILGICLGMQLLFDGSEEFGAYRGMSLVPGRVVSFPPPSQDGPRYKVPQIGWNTVSPARGVDWPGTIMEGQATSSWFYFVHSFYCLPAQQSDIIGVTTYAELEYCSVVRRGHIWGCQFHPERSAKEGLRIYKKFLTY